MSAPPAIERREVFFAGRVQGVGFRYTTSRIAGRLPVVGFVRNLPDGRVHLVAEAPAAVLDDFLERIQQSLGPNIRSIDEATAAATGQFDRFEIRH